MHVGVEEAVAKDLVEESRRGVLQDLGNGMSRRDDRRAVVDDDEPLASLSA
jgi:hypothetical protein